MDLCCELNKLPNLYEHYQEHIICNEGSFIQFLLNDYLADESTDQPDHHNSEHEDLPLQGDHNCCHTPIFFAFVESVSLDNIGFTSHTNSSIYFSNINSAYAVSLFQPPQV
ncbi:hypothetical protein GCM10011506_18770 [Marivirga lumbricoides]|nr:hypothetical protein GCM10011506_18770 [Marivirga lumbricoides]